MANEITIGAQLSASKGGAAITVPLTTKSLDMTGADMTYSTQAVGTSEEALSISADVGTIGYVWVKNNDATNFVWVYQLTGASSGRIKLRPGCVCLFQPEATVVYAKADTAECEVAFAAVEL